MEICNKRIFIKIFSILFLIFILIKPSYSETNFKNLENKKVPFLDFFLLKFENKLTQRTQFLRREVFSTRVQYSNIGIQVKLNKKEEKINITIYAVMDRNRYSKKKYKQKLSDCNQVRNLIFYQKHGYKFFTQKRDPNLSKSAMYNIFKDVFFSNLSFSEEETEFLINKMFVEVTILHPINKIELSCYGQVNDYELK